MPKEVTRQSYSVSETETGIRLTTIQATESAELFSSIEEAVDSKNDESFVKKTIGGSLIALGVVGIGAFARSFIDAPSGEDNAYYAIDASFIFGSAGLALLGNKIYKGGELSRAQWHALKGCLGSHQKSPRAQKSE